MTLSINYSLLDEPVTALTQQHWVNQSNQPLFNKVEQRVLIQLVQTLIYENILPFQTEVIDNQPVFILKGHSVSGEAVDYQFIGEKKHSFDQIKLHKQGAVRTAQSNVETQPITLARFIDEVMQHIPNTLNLLPFINELEQTLLKDAQSLNQPIPASLALIQHNFDALENAIMDAHSYHPCYKSRIGFNLVDNQKYGPEFAQDIPIVWLAVNRSLTSTGVSKDYNYHQFIAQQLTAADFTLFNQTLKVSGKKLEDITLIPVHPWQWHEKIISTFYPELIKGDIIYLGTGQEPYRAQQSIRSLTNVADKQKPYLKTALNITNTSSTRILANHTVMNGPIITDWLQHLISSDATAQALNFVILREFIGVSFDYQGLPECRRNNAYGSLGAIWRENVHKYLQPGESAVPLNGLTHIQQNGTPLVDNWIKQHTLEAWSQQLINVCVLPIVHMLYAEGIGMESHGQNIVLFHKDGWPTRIALKDFHDGVRYCATALGRPDLQPVLKEIPPSHAKINRNSFILTDDLDAVRDFTCDAFFFICLAEIAIFLNSSYELAEEKFWQMTADTIQQYQQQHPEHSSRFAKFDVFAATYQVEELTKRRLFGDGEPRFTNVQNPLAKYGKNSC